MYEPSQSLAAQQFGELTFQQVAVERETRRSQQQQQGGGGYRVTLGREAVVVSNVEFRILRFLARRPYKAFTPERIAAAVSTEHEPVTIENLRSFVVSLREKLGMFGDYIQSVPYIGYRFKA